MPRLPSRLFSSQSSNLQRFPPTNNVRPSFLIGSKDPLDLLLAVCQKAEEEKIVEVEKTAELDSEVEENEAFTATIILSDDSFLEKDDIDSNDNRSDKEDN